MKLVGTVLWWDSKDQNGIIKDHEGNKYYFDASVLRGKCKSTIAAKDIVKFELNKGIAHALCATMVSFASEREIAAFEIKDLKMTA